MLGSVDLGKAAWSSQIRLMHCVRATCSVDSDGCKKPKSAARDGKTQGRVDRPYIEDLSFLDFPYAEIVVGIVWAVGTNYKPVLRSLESIFKKYGYTSNVIRLSSFLSWFNMRLPRSPEHVRIAAGMDAGDALCKKTAQRDILALAAVFQINSKRSYPSKSSYPQPEPLPKTAHILVSLKRPDEVSLLRKIYGSGFFLVGVYASEEERLRYLISTNAPRDAAKKLMERDQKEEDPFGQQTRDTFALSDVFVDFRGAEYRKGLDRFFRLAFSHPYTTPDPDEHAMFLAYASSLRSAQLGRQVGASMVSDKGDVLAVGCNEVPCAHGGLYWPGTGDQRDHVKKEDSNDKRLREIQAEIVSRIGNFLKSKGHKANLLKNLPPNTLRKALDITEFGRATHAEMEALLSCARIGTSPRGATLYTTTFPCHNCTRHIIAAGVKRVVFIEPYAKSRALDLHSDSIMLANPAVAGRRNQRRIPFEPFVGIGPRRYFDLFSVSLSSGYKITRKMDGKIVKWEPSSAIPRIPMQPNSYLVREQVAVREFSRTLNRLEENL